MYKNDFVCGEPVMHCCGGYSEHNNCCPHNFHKGCDCEHGACDFLLHATHELEESLSKLKSRLAGDENTIAENYEKCQDAIDNVSREQQEIKDAIQRIAIENGSASELINIPTKLSQLINDANFVTESKVNNLINSFITVGGYVTRDEVQQIVQNSSGSESITIPTKLSQFTNDLGFITESGFGDLVNTAINNKNYVTESRVTQLLQAAGLSSDGAITQQFKNAIDNAGFVTQEELQQAIQNASISGGSTSSVASIKIGNTTYNPSNGVVSLPAYPTSLPSSDVSAWAKAATKPSYSYPEIGYAVNSTTSAGGALSLAGTTPLHIVNLTGNVSSLTLSSNPAEGHSCHVIFSASAEKTVAIAHDATNRVCPDASDISLTIPAGGYVEIDFLTSNGKVYVRGI